MSHDYIIAYADGISSIYKRNNVETNCYKVKAAKSLVHALSIFKSVTIGNIRDEDILSVLRMK